MSVKMKPLRIINGLAIALALSCPVVASQVVKTPAPGVTLTQDVIPDAAKPRVINLLTVDLTDPDITLSAVLGKDDVNNSDPEKGREIVSSMVGRKNAIAGVNADFFPYTGDPLGLCIVNGEFVSEPYPGRVAMGIMKDRSVVFDNPRMTGKIVLNDGSYRQVDGINRVRETNQIVVYTDTYGPSTLNKYKATDIICKAVDPPLKLGQPICLVVKEVKTDTADVSIEKGTVVISGGGAAGEFLKTHIRVDDKLQVRFDLTSASNIDWTQAEQAVGGGPWLVKNGAEFIDADVEGFVPSFCSTTHPRTAIGVTADKKLLLATFDGRQSISQGMSLKDLSAYMIKLGAVYAINLDGGGSSTMSIRGAVVNSPCESIERPVANAFVVLSNPKEEKNSKDDITKLAISGIQENSATSGEPVKLFLSWGDDHQALTDDQLSNVVWGENGGIGFIDQTGMFTPTAARRGTIRAFYGKQTASVDVTVCPGAPARLTIDSKPDSTTPNRLNITAHAQDAFGNPTIGIPLKLNVTGGKADAEAGVTNDKGNFTTAITWEDVKPDQIKRNIVVSTDALMVTLDCTPAVLTKPAKN